MATKEEYILNQSKQLLKMTRNRKNLNNRLFKHDQMTIKAWQKLNNDLSWLCMEIDKTKERIGYVLGHLILFELRDEYSPSGWHTYKGIKGEMENLKFTE